MFALFTLYIYMYIFYTLLVSEMNLGLSSPEALFDIHEFEHDPAPFFKFAKKLYPGNFQPSATHRFIKTLEDLKKLQRQYTQVPPLYFYAGISSTCILISLMMAVKNIDNLEKICGIDRVVNCHGSFGTGEI